MPTNMPTAQEQEQAKGGGRAGLTPGERLVRRYEAELQLQGAGIQVPLCRAGTQHWWSSCSKEAPPCKMKQSATSGSAAVQGQSPRQDEQNEVALHCA